MPDVPSLILAGERGLIIGIAATVLACYSGRMLTTGTIHVDGRYSILG